MIHRWIYKAVAGDALFLLAVSSAAYHHTGMAWLLYAIYIAGAMSFIAVFRDVASWAQYLGDSIHENAKSIEFHAQCIRDKTIRVEHTGNISNVR